MLKLKKGGNLPVFPTPSFPRTNIFTGLFVIVSIHPLLSLNIKHISDKIESANLQVNLTSRSVELPTNVYKELLSCLLTVRTLSIAKY